MYSCGDDEVGQQGRGGGISGSSGGGVDADATKELRTEKDAGGEEGEGSDAAPTAGRGGRGAGDEGPAPGGVFAGANGAGGGGGSEARASRCMLAPTAVAAPGDCALSGLRVENLAAGDDHCTVLTAPFGGRGGGEAWATRRRRVFTWGLNVAGQCAQGRADEVVRAPSEAELLSGATAVGCGAGHTMVVL